MDHHSQDQMPKLSLLSDERTSKFGRKEDHQVNLTQGTSIISDVRVSINKEISEDLQKFNSIVDLNWAWEFLDDDNEWTQFGCIQCMIIECKHRKYIDSGMKTQHSRVHLQKGVIDFEDGTIQFLPRGETLESVNQIDKQVIRRTTHNKKVRPSGNERYDNRQSH